MNFACTLILLFLNCLCAQVSESPEQCAMNCLSTFRSNLDRCSDGYWDCIEYCGLNNFIFVYLSYFV